ncbi:hypothetical protein [Streptomyces humicola]|nr:hypothetical protein [Streptomyces humicola]
MRSGRSKWGPALLAEMHAPRWAVAALALADMAIGAVCRTNP